MRAEPLSLEVHRGVFVIAACSMNVEGFHSEISGVELARVGICVDRGEWLCKVCIVRRSTCVRPSMYVTEV